MTYEEYTRAEQQNTANLAIFLALYLRPFLEDEQDEESWLSLVMLVYELIAAAHRRSSELARQFYDSERKLHVPPSVDPTAIVRSGVGDSRPDLDRHPIFLSETRPEFVIEGLEPAREQFSRENATEEDLAAVIRQAQKQALAGGRRTLREAVRTDRRAVGWARVAGGGESCAFCLMLISRGPVYKDADQAGLDAGSNVSALEIWNRYNRTGDDSQLMKLMNRWHENCDCRVVPVFDRDDWPGRDQYLEAEDLWIKHTRGKKGREKLIALRKAMGDGYKRTDSAS